MPIQKSTVEEIRQYFDGDVERFSNLETGQVATVDAALALNLVAEVAAATTPQAVNLLDVGCGAGNYTLKLLQHRPGLNVTLVDLSQRMLDRAVERVQPQTTGTVTAIQADIRQLDFGPKRFDIILASAVLHHLRTDAEWRLVFQKFHDILHPGGSVWIFDLVESDIPQIQNILWRRYGEYLTATQGDEYRQTMFEHIIAEDTPRSVLFQLDLLRSVGFRDVEILHKHSCYAAFGAMKH